MASNAVQIVEPEVVDLQVSNGDMRSQVAMLKVTDDASFQYAAGLLLEIKKRYKIIEDRFAEPVSLAHKAHKALTTLRDSVLSPLKQDEMTVKREVGNYQMEVERRRQEEAARLRRQAEAQAEADRIAKAEAQMDQGDIKGCEQTLAAPLKVEPVRVTIPEAPKVAGVSFKDDWRFEIENVNLIPLEYMVVDEKAIARVVKALGAKTPIPGIRVYCEKVVSGRAA